jgi:phosphohistidine swiveling domain-containing protein
VSENPQDYFAGHAALADWLQAADAGRREQLLAADSNRQARLEALNLLIGLPILHLSAFSYRQVVEDEESFTEFRVSAADKAYALRIVDDREKKVLVRNRNLPVPDLVTWLNSSHLSDIEHLVCEFSRHLPNDWATIFVVGSDGIDCEVVRGSLRQLTQGGAGKGRVFSFTMNPTGVRPQSLPHEVFEVASRIVAHVNVGSEAAGAVVRSSGFDVNAAAQVRGYFEAVMDPDGTIAFIDFSPELAEGIVNNDPEFIQPAEEAAVVGRTASRGQAIGIARLVGLDGSVREFSDGDILICTEPSPPMIPVLARAGGLVADRGGLLSHASIVCREIRLPSVVNTENATELIRDGQLIRLDAMAARGHATLLKG